MHAIFTTLSNWLKPNLTRAQRSGNTEHALLALESTCFILLWGSFCLPLVEHFPLHPGTLRSIAGSLTHQSLQINQPWLRTVEIVTPVELEHAEQCMQSIKPWYCSLDVMVSFNKSPRERKGQWSSTIQFSYYTWCDYTELTHSFAKIIGCQLRSYQIVSVAFDETTGFTRWITEQHSNWF